VLRTALTLVMGFTISYAAGADTSSQTPTRHFRCRVPNAPVDTSTSTLPVCRASSATSAPNKALPVQPTTRPATNSQSRAPSSQGAATTPKATSTRVASFTFKEYMNANAQHPAFKAKIADHQRAFIESRAPAVYTPPTPEGTLARESDSSTPAQAAAPPPQPNAGAAPQGAPPIN
jgi:hypothetical protein